MSEKISRKRNLSSHAADRVGPPTAQVRRTRSPNKVVHAVRTATHYECATNKTVAPPARCNDAHCVHDAASLMMTALPNDARLRRIEKTLFNRQAAMHAPTFLRLV